MLTVVDTVGYIDPIVKDRLPKYVTFDNLPKKGDEVMFYGQNEDMVLFFGDAVVSDYGIFYVHSSRFVTTFKNSNDTEPQPAIGQVFIGVHPPEHDAAQ